VRQRALDCLARFGQRVRDIPPQRMRAIATNTVRRLAQPQAFLCPAEAALGPRDRSRRPAARRRA
jgi:exopolyphosphatase/guanosine-5'-triphosphate,3'-diphosphate pyrophosphatase